MFTLFLGQANVLLAHFKENATPPRSVDYTDVAFASLQLRLHMPNLACPDFLKKPLCVPATERIILDPGHSDLPTNEAGKYAMRFSKRVADKKFNIQSTEGQQNMAVALMTYSLLKECTSLSPQQLTLTRWPGETQYGEYLRQKTISSEAPLPLCGPIKDSANDGLMAHILNLHNRLDDPKLSKGSTLLISIHQNAVQTKDKIYDSVKAFVKGVPLKDIKEQTPNPDALKIAQSLVTSVVEETQIYYDGDSLKNLIKSSQVRTQNYLVLQGREKSPLPDDIYPVLLESYFMNQGLGDDLKKKVYDPKLNVLLSIKAEVSDPQSNTKAGPYRVGEAYNLHPVQMGSARGIAKALVERYACP